MRPKYIAVCRCLRRFAAISALATIALLLSATSALAAAAPAWNLTAVAAPTAFAAGDDGTSTAGPMYLFEATNVGGAATSGPVTLQAIAPPGISPSDARGRDDDPSSPEPTCSVAAQVVTCTAPGPLRPGLSLIVEVVVKTEAGLSGSVVSEATVSGGSAPPATTSVQTEIDVEPPSFGFLPGREGLSSLLTEADGSPAGIAGSHPYQLTVGVGFPSRKAADSLINSGHPRDIVVDLPVGMAINPTATPTLCTEARLLESRCPPASQVGLVTLVNAVVGLGSDATPLYNMVPPPGAASNFAFNAGEVGIFVHLLGSIRNGDYGLSAETHDLLAKFPLLGMRLQLWGDPSSPSHDGARGSSVLPQPRALLTLPGSCGPLVTTARADSWEERGVFVERSVESSDLEGSPIAASGCGALDFSPRLQARPTTTVADSPTGLGVDLEVPQHEDPSARASANLRRAEIRLPEGLVANPSGANGLAGCSPAQVGLSSPVGSQPARFDAAPAACPDPSRIGTAQIDTPLLDHVLQGSVYLASPQDNPFASLLALYVTAADESSGVVIKLAGRVEADAATGRLTAGFDVLPQLPIADVELRIFGGATAPLRTPAACGSYATTALLTPWSSAESGPPATPFDTYPIDRAPVGSACAGSEAALPNSPSLDAGAVSPAAGSSTPFVLDLKRSDGTQQISSATLTSPPGLAANLGGIGYCPEVALAVAAGKTGSAELADPGCPPASRVGRATVGAGAGPVPYYVHGDAYLAGPYDGAPLSLAVVVPVLAGPFDLGTVVLRNALRVDPRTAQVTAVSDPVPQIMRGVPLDVRSLRVVLDRPGFTRNPTSCDPMGIDARTVSPAGESASLSSRFQVGGCRRLGFAPKVSVRLLGSTHRGGHPRLRTALTAQRGDANIRRLAVTLPGTALLDSRRIGAVCDREEFAADKCPARSVRGYAKAFSPLLDRPLEGPVYLRASDTRLPGLAASLHGQVDIELSGRIDSIRGRLRTTFQALPDVPLSKVVLTLQGGYRGLLVNSGGLCAAERRAEAAVLAHSGKHHDIGPVVKTDCGKAGRKRLSLEGRTRD